jgi:hypothetical protein
MATISFPGMEAYLKSFDKIASEVPRIESQALFDGAGLLADAVNAEISGLTELNKRQRKGLHDGLGIAGFWSENGATVTKIGFEGYNSIKTKRWPNGQPNAMIARSLIRGTSWMRANRFTARAAKKAREACIRAMQERVDREFAALTK